ncbi:hypothetical protein [Luteibacter sp. RCC_6_2]|uniref:hypothetical protein n=1 Tax=Luteibacter sp. RCC_6_2 TaxID=3239223 RepID=UPI00352682EE
MTPDVHRALSNAAVVTRAITSAKASPEKAAPLRAAEVRKVVEIADPDYGPDVAAVTSMLIIYECMATRAEVTGSEKALRLLRPGLQMRDLDLSKARVRIRFPDIEGGGKERIGRLSEGASAWLRYWISMRGAQEGPLFSAPMLTISNARSIAHQGGPVDIWRRLQQREGLAERSGIGRGRITVTALKFGRAMALFEAGFSLDYIVRASSWEQTGALITALIKPRESWSYRRRRESHRLEWPLPPSGADSINPVQCLLF